MLDNGNNDKSSLNCTENNDYLTWNLIFVNYMRSKC